MTQNISRVIANTRPHTQGVSAVKTYDVPALVVSDESDNITDLLAERLRTTPKLPLFALQNSNGSWSDVTCESFYDQVVALAKGLVASGIQPGQAVAIMSRTRYEWTVIDFAIWFAGAISVPIYETSSASQMEWILSDSDAVALFVENREHEVRFNQIKQQAPLVRQLWRLDDNSLEHLVKLGKETSSETIEMRRKSARLRDIATIIYTSGTTGQPKGCELTHRGFVELSRNTKIEIPEVLHEGNSTLLFLPLAHVFARFVEVLAVHSGIKVGHQPDTKNVGPAMESFKPNFLLAVPRVFEKVYNSAEQKAEAGGKGKIFRKAVYTAIAYSKALDTPTGPNLGLKIQHAIFDRLVYKKLRAAMGGRVKYAISGGAPLGARLGHFYRAIGLTVLEGYGLTETTAPSMVGRPTDVKIGKVGRLLPGTGIKIADDGEVWLRGNNILKGYWRNPKATAEAFEGDWFKTGDIGDLDEDGFLTITGRKKEIIVTAGGKNVAPTQLEDPLRANPVIGQAILLGDQRPYIAALISLDSEMLPIWLSNNGADRGMSIADAAKNPIVINEIQRAIDRVNRNVSKAEAIKNFTVIDTELTEESGHLTPSLKIKRAKVLSDFSDVIEKLYASKPLVS
jgi:long-chain acyl-CoA synthetase